jgi:hypothetical protein
LQVVVIAGLGVRELGMRVRRIDHPIGCTFTSVVIDRDFIKVLMDVIPPPKELKAVSIGRNTARISLSGCDPAPPIAVT